jgi:hypothetical protein
LSHTQYFPRLIRPCKARTPRTERPHPPNRFIRQIGLILCPAPALQSKVLSTEESDVPFILDLFRRARFPFSFRVRQWLPRFFIGLNHV